MRNHKWPALAILLMLLAYAPCSAGQGAPAKAKPWPVAAPHAIGLEPTKLAMLDADLASGKYGLVDSMLVIRCGKQGFEHAYVRDYDKIYGERAKKMGPLNHDLQGPYNYFSTEFHPYYKHSDLHTMQSVSKTVTSITMGVAMQRGEFQVDLDAPILKYFDGYKIANLDDRKRRITLRHLLTMSSGLEWHEDLAYDDPKNSADVMEATRDWVQYVIDQPMVSEPGNFWKHTPLGLPDTEGGLYLASRDLAKIGLLVLQGGLWEGKRIVPADWIKESVAPAISTGDGGWKYGFQWWLIPYGKSGEKLAWAAHGFGGQQLIVVPEYDLIVVFTGWDILPSSEKHKHDQLERILEAVDEQYRCASVPGQVGN
jgi:hypothetical protein